MSDNGTNNNVANRGISLPSLSELAKTNQWVSIYAAALLLDRDPASLKLEIKKPAGNGLNGTTVLVPRKEKGKHLEFSAQSLLAYSQLARPRGGFGRAASSEGHTWHTSRIAPDKVEEIRKYLAGFNVQLIDPTEKLKAAKAKKLAEQQSQPQAA